MGSLVSTLLNTTIVCAGITATVGYAILLLSPLDSIVMTSVKNSYNVGFSVSLVLDAFFDSISFWNLSISLVLNAFPIQNGTGHDNCLRVEE